MLKVSVRVSEYSVLVGGEEAILKVESREVSDTWNYTMTVTNSKEPWISGDVVLRSGNWEEYEA